MRTLPFLLLSACLVPSSWLESIELAASIHEETDPRSVDPNDAPALGHPNPVVSLPVEGDPTDTAEPTTPDEPAAPVDADGDGALSDVDCDDDDGEVFPGALELCGNGRDDDCDPTPYTCGLGPDITDAQASWHVLGNHAYAALGTRLLGGEDLSGDGRPDLVATGGCPAAPNGDSTCGGLIYALNLAVRSKGFSDAESIHHTRIVRGTEPSPEPALAFGRGAGGVTLHVADPWAAWGEGGVIHTLVAPLWSGSRPLAEMGAWVQSGEQDAPLAPAVAILPGATGNTVLAISTHPATGYRQLVWGLPAASRTSGWSLSDIWDGTEIVAGGQQPSSDEVVDVAAGWDVVGSPDPDFAIAALDEQGGGAFYAWASLPSGGTLDLADASIRATWTLAPGTHDGIFRVHLVPDVTGDGRSDLVVAAPCISSFCTEGGSVWVVPGGQQFVGQQADLATVGSSRPGLHLAGSVARAALGSAVGTADLNGDGQPDLVLGAPGEMGFTGSVYVLYGPLPTGDYTTSDVGHDLVGSHVSGSEMSARFGASLHGAGDLDGDGVDEIAVAAPRAQGPTGAYATGRIFVLAGGAE